MGEIICLAIAATLFLLYLSFQFRDAKKFISEINRTEPEKFIKARNLVRWIVSLLLATFIALVALAWHYQMISADMIRPMGWLAFFWIVSLIGIWLPSRPLRLLATLLILIPIALAALILFSIAMFGPDLKGPRDDPWPSVLGILTVTACLPMAAFILLEIKLSLAN